MAGVTIRRPGMQKFMKTDIRRFGELMQRTIEAQINLRVPVLSGRTKASIRGTKISIRGYHMRFTIEAKSGYSLYPEEGTGIYAGQGYIYPKRAQAMVFKPQGSSKLIFARRIKGQPGQHYMRNGLVAGMRLI